MPCKNALAVFFVFSLISLESHALSVWQHAGRTFTDAFDTTGLEVLLIGSAATAIAFGQDQAVHDAWNNHQRMSSDVSGFGNFWGTGIPEAAVALGQLVFDQERGIADVEGLASSTAVTFGLKYAVGRARPDSNTATSFPSGHTQISFAFATSMTKSYGWWVGTPALSLGVFTGLSRIADNAHWLSDVVAGATVGVLFGRASFQHHVRILPMVFENNDHGYGLTLGWRF